ncbi:hypothetical protein NFI96_020808, partial [Prochilodus magdalenae]
GDSAGESTHHPRETTNMRTQTVASYFRYSLMDLLSKMVAGQPHFVRCIKPNNDRQAHKFDREKVLIQLRYTGILETAKIRRQGYSHRILFTNFIKRYFILAFRANEEPAVSPETCAAILEKAKLENWVLGKTKVFLKYYHVEHLNLMIRRNTDRIVLVQAYVRGWLGVRRYRKILEKRERSAVVLQSAYRGHKVRRQVADDKDKARLENLIIKLQAACRGYLARKTYKELVDEKNKAAAKIQAHYRGHRERKSFQKKKEAMQKEKAQKDDEEQEDRPAPAESTQEGEGAEPGDEDEKAAVVLQSNYRGYRERKKFKEQRERNKTLSGDELAVPSSSPGEESGPEAEEQLDVVAEEEEEVAEAANQKTGEEDVDGEQEAKAATVIQSNFRGHKERKRLQEEGKIPARGAKAKDTRAEVQESVTEPSVVEEPGPEETGDDKTGATGGEEEEAKAAVVIQSNFRGHKERKRLQEEGKIPKKSKMVDETVEPTPVGQGAPAESLEETPEQAEHDEERAATVLQSNYRGHRERKRLKEQREGAEGATEPPAEELQEEEVPGGQQEQGKETGIEDGQYDEEQAAVKIQSNFRGYKDRKNLKATALREEEEVEMFSKQISSLSQDYLTLQEKLNDIILAHQINPVSNGMFMKGQALNGHAETPPQQSADPKQTRTPRRTQKPKTLNTPEDSTYYNLIHRSVQDDKKRPRKQSPKKLLDIDDQYYQGLSNSKSTSCLPSETQTSSEISAPAERRHSTERPLSDVPRSDTPKPPKENRRSFPRMPSTESQSEDNPYDYRKLLRKTSQRGRLIKQY